MRAFNHACEAMHGSTARTLDVRKPSCSSVPLGNNNCI